MRYSDSVDLGQEYRQLPLSAYSWNWGGYAYIEYMPTPREDYIYDETDKWDKK